MRCYLCRGLSAPLAKNHWEGLKSRWINLTPFATNVLNRSKRLFKNWRTDVESVWKHTLFTVYSTSIKIDRENSATATNSSLRIVIECFGVSLETPFYKITMYITSSINHSKVTGTAKIHRTCITEYMQWHISSFKPRRLKASRDSDFHQTIKRTNPSFRIITQGTSYNIIPAIFLSTNSRFRSLAGRMLWQKKPMESNMLAVCITRQCKAPLSNVFLKKSVIQVFQFIIFYYGLSTGKSTRLHINLHCKHIEHHLPL